MLAYFLFLINEPRLCCSLINIMGNINADATAESDHERVSLCASKDISYYTGIAHFRIGLMTYLLVARCARSIGKYKL